MEWSDLPRERYLESSRAQEVIAEWDKKFGGYETVKDTAPPKIYSPFQFDWNFPGRSYVINNTVHRYFIIEHLLSEGALDGKNLKGEILDIASFLGAAVDALAAFGGRVRGTDDGRYEYFSIGNRDIGWLDGKSALKYYYYPPKKLDIISFFNLGCDHGSGSIPEWCSCAFPALNDGGQILLTFSSPHFMEEELGSIPEAQIIKLPERLRKYGDYYAFTARKPKTANREPEDSET